MSDDTAKYLIGAVAGLLVFGTSIAAFRRELSTFLLRLSRIHIAGPGGIKVEMSGEVAADITAGLLSEMDTLITKHLNAEEVHLFLKIASMPPLPELAQVIEGFDRNDERALGALRALRGVYFIRPKEGGKWELGKHVEVTTLGRIVATHKREVLERAARGGVADGGTPGSPR